MSDSLLELIQKSEAPLSAQAVDLVAKLRRGAALQRVSFSPPDDLLSKEPPRFAFEYTDSALGPLSILRTELPWAPRLDRDLFALGVRVTSPDEEALRAGTNLVHSLAYLDIRYGRDYVSAVLRELLQERYGHFEAMAAMLKRLAHAAPSRGDHYLDCRLGLEQQIDGYGNSLVLELRYENGLAHRILVAGLLYLLDRRHTLTIRSVMFPGSGSFSF